MHSVRLDCCSMYGGMPMLRGNARVHYPYEVCAMLVCMRLTFSQSSTGGLLWSLPTICILTSRLATRSCSFCLSACGCRFYLKVTHGEGGRCFAQGPDMSWASRMCVYCMSTNGWHDNTAQHLQKSCKINAVT